jgi:hypothetical protein
VRLERDLKEVPLREYDPPAMLARAFELAGASRCCEARCHLVPVTVRGRSASAPPIRSEALHAASMISVTQSCHASMGVPHFAVGRTGGGLYAATSNMILCMPFVSVTDPRST